jgi:ribosomal protein S18 acetylase RimI-like enzyme
MVEPPFTIRPMTPADLPAAAAVFVAAFREPPYQEAWDPEDAAAWLGVYCERCPEDCFCVDRHGEIVGLAVCTTVLQRRAVIEELVMAPDYQQQGLGSALLEHCLAHFRARGIGCVELVARRGAPAWEFYRRRGFREARRHALLVREL